MITTDQWNNEPVVWQVDLLDGRVRPLNIVQRQIFWPVIHSQYFVTKEEAEEWLLKHLLERLNDD